jgi:pyridoxamine 5'-phosphate oxidase
MAGKGEFSEVTVEHDPFMQFGNWYEEHLSSVTKVPESMYLGTSSTEGKVSVRTVLLKEFNETGFVFFTNYNSKKGSQLSSNPRASLLFHWPESDRQIRIEGITEKLSQVESENYFRTRPKESQLSTWASQQSSIIPDREYLENKFMFYKSMYHNKPVPKPGYWGGFRLIPDWFEFWQNGEYRLHDRITYSRKGEDWIIERLSP